MIDNRVRKKLRYLGIRLDSKVFYIMRLISSIILFLILLFMVDYGYIVAPVCVVIYYILVEYIILDLGIKRRNIELEDDALDFIPIFLIALKNKRNVKSALIVSIELVDNTLSKEFKKALRSSRLGKSLDESLREIKENISSSVITNIIINIMEANRLGNNINDNVNMQLDYIRSKKRIKLLRKYKIIPLKLAILSICFVFLAIVILIMFNFYS